LGDERLDRGGIGRDRIDRPGDRPPPGGEGASAAGRSVVDCERAHGCSATSAESAANRISRCLQSISDLVEMAPPGLSHLRLPTTAAAHYGSRVAYDVGRREPALDRGGAEDADQGDLLATRRRED